MKRWRFSRRKTSPRFFVNPISNFDALILAGGKSSRMGRDKALIEVGGKTLLARQIDLAREIGAADIFISARPDAHYPPSGCRVLHDDFLESGPLAGIARGLSVTREPLLLVLAVDMANLCADFLGKILAGCADGIGAVPRVNAVIEPLAAIYPKTALELCGNLLTPSLAGTSPGAKLFAQACVEAGLARFVTVAPAEAGYFKSWNTPTDLRWKITGGVRRAET
jgi:molybdenum cofactor guanylyltransferase